MSQINSKGRQPILGYRALYFSVSAAEWGSHCF
jgi:hypothetical protein